MWQKLAESSEVCILEAENRFPLQASVVDQPVTSEKAQCLITQDCPCHLQRDGLALAKNWQRVFLQGLLGVVFLCYGGPTFTA